MNFNVAMLVIVLALISMILGPLGTIWALNTISEQANFGWKIPHAFWTYVAVWTLMLLWKNTSVSKS